MSPDASMNQSTSGIRPLLVVGTRPECIKMAPIIQECHQRAGVDPVVCFTGQHREMLAQVSNYFQIQSDIDLDLMRPDQTLASLTAACIQALDQVVNSKKPDVVVAQGDTTTVLASSMVAFYHQIPFVHVEAGLRTGNLYSPWPEEFNRRVAGITAARHCAPTNEAADNLRREGVAEDSIRVTGNTVIDSLLWTVNRERANSAVWEEKYAFLNDQKTVLITGHRRENFGPKMKSVLSALARLANQFEDVQWIYPVHLNPNVRGPVHETLGGAANIHLVPPADYPEFVWLMDRCRIIITDSGGVQEEAPTLKKPVLVTRDTTERPEAVTAGAVQLVGSDAEKIVQTAERLLSDDDEYSRWQIENNPYGDGQASQRVVDSICELGGSVARAA